jgi:glycyl-tRNA synthetase
MFLVNQRWGHFWEGAEIFNMMFKTQVGATEDETSISYLRPETAGGIFVNFKNIVDTFHPKLSFGIAQIGKAFRNEIAPRDFVFRVREFEQMEIEYFVKPEMWEAAFEQFRTEMLRFAEDIGLNPKHVHELEVAKDDLAHYSKRTIDFEFEYPFGKKELYGLAYRTDFDLKQHSEHSTVDLSYFDEETKGRLIPHVIEPSFGVDRTILAIFADAYTEDELGGEKRVYLKFNKKVAPVLAAVFPLLKNKPELVTKAREVYAMLKKEIPNDVQPKTSEGAEQNKKILGLYQTEYKKVGTCTLTITVIGVSVDVDIPFYLNLGKVTMYGVNAG